MRGLFKNQRLQSGSSPRVNYAPNFTVLQVCIISRSPQNEFPISFSPSILLLVYPSSCQLWKRCAVSSCPNALLSPEQLQFNHLNDFSRWFCPTSSAGAALHSKQQHSFHVWELLSWRLNIGFCTTHFLSESVHHFLCFYFYFQTTRKAKKKQ